MKYVNVNMVKSKHVGGRKMMQGMKTMRMFGWHPAGEYRVSDFGYCRSISTEWACANKNLLATGAYP